MKAVRTIFFSFIFFFLTFSLRSLADNKCITQIIVKNPSGGYHFGAIMKPPKGGDYSVWFPIVPRSVAVDSQGNIYIGDSVNKRILKFSKEGKVLLQVKLRPAKKKPKPEISHIIKEIGVDKNDNIYVWNYFEDRIEIFTNKGEFIGFTDSENETVKQLFTKVPSGKLEGYQYEIASYVPDPNKPGTLLYKITILDKNKKSITECNDVEIAEDEEGLIYAIDQDGYLYTFDYYKTIDVIKINPFKELK